MGPSVPRSPTTCRTTPSDCGSSRRRPPLTGWPRPVAERVRDDGATGVEVALWRIGLDTADGLRLRLHEVLTGTASP